MVKVRKSDKKKSAKPAPAKKTKVLSAEEQAEREARKAAKTAVAEAEKLAKISAKKKAKDKLEKDQKAKQTTALTHLASDAKEINVRMGKANKLASDADDHRLAAACKMAEAKERCRESKVNFQEWCAANIDLSYETVRKLLPVGSAERENEGDGQVMLTDMREQNKNRNKKARAEKKEKGKKAPADPDTPKARKIPAGQQALEAMDRMKGEELGNLIKSKAQEAGMVLVPKDQVKAGNNTTMEVGFKRLSSKAQMAFVRWAAEEVGVKLDTSGEAEENDD